MDYIGLDPMIGLECTNCQQVTRLQYSILLDSAMLEDRLGCDGCHMEIDHGWTTVGLVQNIIRRRMGQAHRTRTDLPNAM